MTSILIVDDDLQLLRAMRINLRARGYHVIPSADGTAALAAAADQHPDLAIVDLGLPDIDGVEVIAGLRGWTSLPILVLSARHDSTDKVCALDAGADDYVTKPFNMDELLARLRATLRRAPVDGPAPVVTTAAFTVDLAAKTATRGDTAVRLTPTEWGLLEVLARHPGQLVSQRDLLHQVWGPAYDTEGHYLRVHMAHLRRKLEPDPSHPQHLLTEAGMGYRLQP